VTRGIPRRRERVWALAATTLYFALLYHVYVVDLRMWDYLGFQLGDFDAGTILACWVLAMIPLLLLPTRVSRLSGFLAWCLYYFVYVPASLYPVLQGLRPDSIRYPMALCAGFCLLVTISGIRPAPTAAARPATRASNFHAVFWTLYACLVLYTLSVFAGSLSLAGVTEVDEQRSRGGELISGTFVGYAVGWLSGCFNPLLVGIGLIHKKRFLFILGSLGQVFVYSTSAMKSILLSVVLIGIIYLVSLRKERIDYRGIAMFSVASLAVPLSFGLFLSEDASGIYDVVSALIYMRTYGMVGALSGTYFDFFSQNPLTHYSHINLVRSLIAYPYTDSIGEVVGQSMGLDMNANANFFATDGMAAGGLAGVVFIGAFVGSVLRVVDRLIPKENLRLACAAAVPAIIGLSNASFFTTLLTGGFIPLVLALHYWRGSFLSVRPRPGVKRLPHRPTDAPL
jgi:hypothetical protein